MSYCGSCMGGWVGGWVVWLGKQPSRAMTGSVGGWVGGWMVEEKVVGMRCWSGWEILIFLLFPLFSHPPTHPPITYSTSSNPRLVLLYLLNHPPTHLPTHPPCITLSIIGQM